MVYFQCDQAWVAVKIKDSKTAEIFYQGMCKDDPAIPKLWKFLYWLETQSFKYNVATNLKEFGLCDAAVVPRQDAILNVQAQIDQARGSAYRPGYHPTEMKDDKPKSGMATAMKLEQELRIDALRNRLDTIKELTDSLTKKYSGITPPIDSECYRLLRNIGKYLVELQEIL